VACERRNGQSSFEEAARARQKHTSRARQTQECDLRLKRRSTLCWCRFSLQWCEMCVSERTTARGVVARARVGTGEMENERGRVWRGACRGEQRPATSRSSSWQQRRQRQRAIADTSGDESGVKRLPCGRASERRRAAPERRRWRRARRPPSLRRRHAPRVVICAMASPFARRLSRRSSRSTAVSRRALATIRWRHRVADARRLAATPLSARCAPLPHASH
jgi:hypothetical protein